MSTTRAPLARRDIVALLAGLLASGLFGLGSMVTYPRPGLDPSYLYAVHHASAAGLRWGREFMATYGFLGDVLQPIAIDGFPFRFLVFQLALVVGTGLAAWAHVRAGAAGCTRWLVPAVVALPYAVHVQGLEQRWIALTLLLALLARRTAGRAGMGLWAAAGVAGGVLSQAKVSLGLGMALTAGCAALLAPRVRDALGRALVVGLALTGGALAAWLAQYHSPAGLLDWLRLALAATAAYSSAMSLAPPETAAFAWSFLGGLAALVAWVALARGPGRWPVLAACLAPLAVAWKYSMVRLDTAHHHAFPLCLLLVGALVALEAPPAGRALARLPLLGLGLAAPLACWIHFDPPPPRQEPPAPTAWGTLLGPARLPGLAGAGEFLRPAATARRLAERSAAAEAALVLPRLSQTLGAAAVDVYPWEASWVQANRLRWRPRPVFGSFAAFTPHLAGLNAVFFEADDRPPYLIWHLVNDYGGATDSIDQRHVFWDEPPALRAIASRYEPEAATPGFLLLRARAEARWLRREPLGSARAAWGQALAVPRGAGPILAEIALPARPAWTALRRVLFRDPPAFIALAYEDGAGATYRFVPEQASTGLWISPLPRNHVELASLLAGGPAPAVSAIAFHGDWATPEGPPVTVTWWGLR